MTIEEFDKTKFRGSMKVIFDGEIKDICSLNKNQKLIGLENEFDDELYWVRCENVELVK